MNLSNGNTLYYLYMTRPALFTQYLFYSRVLLKMSHQMGLMHNILLYSFTPTHPATSTMQGLLKKISMELFRCAMNAL